MRLSKGEAVERLLKNKDFKEIILKDFLEQSVLSLSNNLSNVKPENRQLIIEQLIARNALKYYLELIREDAYRAKEELSGGSVDE